MPERVATDSVDPGLLLRMTTSEVRSIINEDGSCSDEHLELISDRDVVTILQQIHLNRVIDRRLMALQRQGRLGFYLSSTGEEIVSIGAACAMRQDDPIFLAYREFGVLLWRGVSLEAIMHQYIGNAQDLMKGRQMPIHHCYREHHIPSVSSPVATQLPHACGYGYAAKILGTEQVVLAFLGEGSASEGDFHTALNFSGVLNSQVVFIIRNNGYAISTPESQQTKASNLAVRAEGYGIAGVRIDGNDLLAVVQTVSEAAARARQGGGPTLIEALTYRMGAHSSADDPTRYRPDEEVKEWEKVDGLTRLTRHGQWRGVWTEEIERQATADAESKITSLIADCERLPPPPIETLFEDVYEHTPECLQGQRDEYLQYLRRRDQE